MRSWQLSNDAYVSCQSLQIKNATPYIDRLHLDPIPKLIEWAIFQGFRAAKYLENTMKIAGLLILQEFYP